MPKLKQLDPEALDEGRWLTLVSEPIIEDGKEIGRDEARVRVLSARSKRAESIAAEVARIYREQLRSEETEIKRRALVDMAAHTACLFITEVDNLETHYGVMTNDFASKFEAFRDRRYVAYRDAVLDFAENDNAFRPYEPARDECARGNSSTPSDIDSGGKRGAGKKKAA